MSTLKASSVQHPSASSPNIEMTQDGDVSTSRHISSAGNVSAAELHSATLKHPLAASAGVVLHADGTVEFPNNVEPSIASQYANNYVAHTGGSIVNYSTPGNIDAQIDALTDGDALVLAPGAYSVDRRNDPVSEGMHRDKNVLICSSSDNASDVVISYDPDGEVAARDSAFFGWGDASSWQIVAFCKIVRSPSGGQDGNNYALSITKSRPTGPNPKMSAVNCLFDLNGYSLSWLYDNPQYLGQMRYSRCSFINYPSWLGNYSGNAANVKVTSCAFSGSYNGGASFSGTQYANVVQQDGSYPVVDYPGGHLYLPVGLEQPVFF